MYDPKEIRKDIKPDGNVVRGDVVESEDIKPPTDETETDEECTHKD